jgi:hypothetical protein
MLADDAGVAEVVDVAACLACAACAAERDGAGGSSAGRGGGVWGFSPAAMIGQVVEVRGEPAGGEAPQGFAGLE